MTSIGVLHPGEMGISVAVSAIRNGHIVHWASENRSPMSLSRAVEHKLIDSVSLSQLCRDSQIILGICPPHAAEDVAKSVVAAGYRGYYLDANAISPQRAVRIGRMMETNGIRFIDGSIVGGPAWKLKETWLYLSGREAKVIADCFVNGPLETKVISDEVGKASALKMCYAAYSKGTTALLAAILAAAEEFGVRDELSRHWEEDEPGFVEQAEGRTMRVTAKAWRFEGEMFEIASTFREAGLPGGFHEAAAEVYQRLAGYKNAGQRPTLSDVLETLIGIR